MEGNFKSKPPKVSLVESIRSIGYNFNSALADIIDNSISAGAKNIDIYLASNIPAIVICDDGCGMSSEELDIAMSFGSRSPSEERSINDLGRFGLGLKSASFSQCKNLTVTTKKDGKISSMTWDLDIVQQKQDWLVKTNEEFEYQSFPYVEYYLNKKEHGTIVEWSQFDRIRDANNQLELTLSRYVTEASKYLALVFHKYLEKGLSIKVNGNELPIIDPFLKRKSTTLRPSSPSLEHEGKRITISVQPYILPFMKDLTVEDFETLGETDNKKIRGQQGFYIYRSDRLITWGTWLGLSVINETYKNARIEVNIPNSCDDMWEVDVKKSTAAIPGKIQSTLRAHVASSISESHQVCTRRTIKISLDKQTQKIWDRLDTDNLVEYKINKKLPIIELIKSKLNKDDAKLVDVLINDIENNLPKVQIYGDMADVKTKIKEQSELNDILNNISMLLSVMVNATFEEKKEIVLELLESEPYCYYNEEINKFLEEIK